MELAALYQLYKANPLVQTDTRKLQPGGLFFALSGGNFNGNAFAAAALEQGVAYAVIDDATYQNSDNMILVHNVLETLQALATYHRQQLQIPVIAITGSNGKTTTKELITAALSAKYRTYATIGNLNNHIGVPLTLLRIPADAEMAIIEMGANHQKEIAALCQIARPTHGIITNCGKAHIEGFGGVEGVRKGKGELYDYLRLAGGVVFRNTDLDYLEGMAAGIGNQITYGSGNAVYVGKPLMNGVFLDVAVLTRGAEAVVNTQLVGEYNFPNVLVAIAIGLHFGVDIDTLKAAISRYSPDNSRSQWLQKVTNQLILDAYNANPTSMRAAILNFATSGLPHKILWIGGMKEMGVDERQEHQELVALIKSYEWDDVVLVGNEFLGLQEGYTWFADSEQAAAYIRANPPVNSAILIKGSRGSRMEAMAAVLGQ